jgi:hypothetical protein
MCKVISIGSFSGGSFGCEGNPSKVYEYFAVDTDMEAAQRSGSIAFRTREAAEQRLSEITGQPATHVVVQYVGGGAPRGWRLIEQPQPEHVIRLMFGAFTGKGSAGRYQNRSDLQIWTVAEAKKTGLI